jgi:excisionase family DNA binding protein
MTNPDWINKPAYSAREVADLLGISKSTVYESIKRGDIKTIQVGARRHIISSVELARIVNGE